ncbi:antiterminator Q family protein [Pasteurella sp. PK-2025]|uniref:antiterminator Q family protein n=1 Tax=unclassified Pasteurella TaxID=2621516 RepID=UPI003C76F030
MTINRSDVKKMLRKWGHWGNVRFGTEYPSHAPLMYQRKKICYCSTTCTDAQGMILDQYVSNLAFVNNEYRELLVAIYVYQTPLSEISERNDRSERTIRDWIETAELIVLGQIIQNTKIMATLSFLLD